MSAVASRRGLLGWLAAAPAAAVAVAAPATLAIGQPEPDWQTKPVEQWTKFDFLAEAEHHVASLSERIRQNPRNRHALVKLEWWERELAYIKGSIATAMTSGGIH